jgi:hypothetical protein
MKRRPQNAEFKRFNALTDRLLSVSKETVDKRIAAYEAEREKTPRMLRPGRNPKGYVRPTPADDREGE